MLQAVISHAINKPPASQPTPPPTTPAINPPNEKTNVPTPLPDTTVTSRKASTMSRSCGGRRKLEMKSSQLSVSRRKSSGRSNSRDCERNRQRKRGRREGEVIREDGEIKRMRRERVGSWRRSGVVQSQNKENTTPPTDSTNTPAVYLNTPPPPDTPPHLNTAVTPPHPDTPPPTDTGNPDTFPEHPAPSSVSSVADDTDSSNTPSPAHTPIPINSLTSSEIMTPASENTTQSSCDGTQTPNVDSLTQDEEEEREEVIVPMTTSQLPRDNVHSHDTDLLGVLSEEVIQQTSELFETQSTGDPCERMSVEPSTKDQSEPASEYPTEEDVIDILVDREEGEISGEDVDEDILAPSSLDCRPPTPSSSPYKIGLLERRGRGEREGKELPLRKRRLVLSGSVDKRDRREGRSHHHRTRTDRSLTHVSDLEPHRDRHLRSDRCRRGCRCRGKSSRSPPPLDLRDRLRLHPPPLPSPYHHHHRSLHARRH